MEPPDETDIVEAFREKIRRAYEPERVKALEARRQDWEEMRNKKSLEERFGMGTFGCHEAVHVTMLVVDLIEEQLVEHSAVLLDPFWYGQVRDAQQTLFNAYNHIAGLHLGTTEGADEGPSAPVPPPQSRSGGHIRLVPPLEDQDGKDDLSGSEPEGRD